MPLPSPLTGVYPQSGLGVGDSFGDYPTDNYQTWTHQLPWPLWNECGNAEKLVVHIEPAFSGLVSGTTCDWVVIQGGVNDFLANDTAVDVEAAVSSMITTAQTAGLEVIICNVAPWKAQASWTQARQDQQDLYNAWLLAQQVPLGFTLVDIFTPLEDVADTLNAAYDRGDGLHLNAAGATVMADAIDTVLYDLGLYGSAVMNTYLWKGAVQPAEVGASGNELKIYKGAIEPAYTSVAGSNHPFIAIGRRTASQMRPKQRMRKPKRGLFR